MWVWRESGHRPGMKGRGLELRGKGAEGSEPTGFGYHRLLCSFPAGHWALASLPVTWRDDGAYRAGLLLRPLNDITRGPWPIAAPP